MPNKSQRIADILGEQYADLVHTPWSPAFDEISACLKQLGLPQLQRHILKETLHLSYLSRRYPKTYKFSIHAIAEEVGIVPWYCAEQMKLLAQIKDQEGHIIQEHASPLLVLTRPKNGIAYGVDVGPLLALPQSMARQKKRSHHAQRPALVAMIAARPRSASAHQAPKEPPAAPAQELRSAAPSIDRAAALALPEVCSAALVASLDRLRIDQENLPALVAFVQQQRGGLDTGALLQAIERATDQATADIARQGERITSRYGLLTFKIKTATRDIQQELQAAAQCIAEQQRDQAAMLAGLNEDGQRFYAYGSAHDWPIFRYRRIWSGFEDWLYFADAHKNEPQILAAALASMEQPDQAPKIEASPLPDQAGPIEAPDLAEAMQEQEEAAPARIEAAADAEQEQPDQAGPIEAPTSSPDQPARIIPISSKVGRRRELDRLAARKGYPTINAPGIGRIEGERWQWFIWNTKLDNLGKAAAALRGWPDVIEAPSMEQEQPDQAGPIEAPTSNPDQPATRKTQVILDALVKFAGDSAAGLL